jgi:hypothetical protein
MCEQLHTRRWSIVLTRAHIETQCIGEANMGVCVLYKFYLAPSWDPNSTHAVKHGKSLQLKSADLVA